jgi:hypothetical protein
MTDPRLAGHPVHAVIRALLATRLLAWRRASAHGAVVRPTDGAEHNVVIPNAATEQIMQFVAGVKECAVTATVFLPKVRCGIVVKF